MSIKDLFEKGHSLKFLKNKSQDDLAKELDSERHIDVHVVQRNRFIPDTDFNDPSAFAHFGLAELYYEESFKRIYQTYPYDGSLTEKIEWENESTYLDLFIFENEYPRTNGFVTIGQSSSYVGTKNTVINAFSSSTPQYIFIKGGPHADPDGNYKNPFSAGPSTVGISKANIYHTSSQRTNNLEVDLKKGVTVEFWLKKQVWAASGSTTQAETFFHLWNSGSVIGSPATANGSLRIYAYGKTGEATTLRTNITSGSVSLDFNHDTGLTDIADGVWHHYAVTFETVGTDSISNLYVDGLHNSRLTDGDTILALDGTMIAAIGGLAGPITGAAATGKAWSTVTGSSYDEFRYWKTVRNAQQIGRFYKDQVGGGTNTDNFKYNKETRPVDLGVYYKFNEGITEVNSVDSTILDYSGRISNGTYVNYKSDSRSTGSAIVLSSAAAREFKDPIIYSTHPEVSALINNKTATGSMHDHGNAVSIFKSLPGWIAEEDEEESGHLKYLTQQ